MAANDVMINSSDDQRRDGDAWRSESICRKHPTRWWFGGDQRETAVARGLCATCGVQSACLEFALGRPEMLGIWAATTPSDRAAIRRARAAPAPVAPDAVVSDLFTEAPAVDRESAVPMVTMRAADTDFDLDIDLAGLLDLESEHALDARAAVDASRSAALDLAPAPRSTRGFGRGPSRRAVPDDELLTPAEAARKLGVTPNTVTRWSRAGRISAIQTIGGHRRFRRCEIERVLREANTTGPAPV